MYTVDLAILFDEGLRSSMYQADPYTFFFASSPSNGALVDRPDKGMFIHRFGDAFSMEYGDVRHYDYTSVRECRPRLPICARYCFPTRVARFISCVFPILAELRRRDKVSSGSIRLRVRCAVPRQSLRPSTLHGPRDRLGLELDSSDAQAASPQRAARAQGRGGHVLPTASVRRAF